MGKATRDPIDRFVEKVEFTADCWEYRGRRDKRGYGVFNVGGRRRMSAMRFAWQAFVAPLGEGEVPDHLCRNRGCVNPDHLEPVTNVENVLRGESPPAQNRRKTVCKNGHPFSPENTRTDRNGGRHCRTCHREHEARRMARMAAKDPGYRGREAERVRAYRARVKAELAQYEAEAARRGWGGVR